jgi:hypothetical protein
MTFSPEPSLPAIHLDSSIATEAGNGHAAAAAETSHDGLPPIQTFEGEWESWFAWHPVRLYMTSRFAWLTTIYRRCVKKGNIESCDYTDAPEEFPS